MVEQRTRLITEAEAVKENATAGTRWSERQDKARPEVRTLSAAPSLSESISFRRESAHELMRSTLAPCGTATDYKPDWTILVSELKLGLERVGLSMKLDQGPSGELRVLDSGFTDQVLLDCISEEVLRIKAVVYNSLNDLNKLFHVDRALYTNSPALPLFFEFTPENVASMKTPLIISEVKLYTVEKLWGLSTLRMIR